MKHFGLFNLALLSKWKLRVLNGGYALRSDIISARYGNVKFEVLCGPYVSRKSSLWWMDMCAIGELLNNYFSQSNWFSSSVSCKIGNGGILYFWRHIWLGFSSFDILFPSLFQLYGSSCLRVRDVEI